MAKALIIYASWTGNTEEIARILAATLSKLSIEVEWIECQQIDASAFLSADICVIATYTFGSAGDLPAEFEAIYFDLEKLNLKGKVFGVLGSGEELYGYFCKSVDDFDKQFEFTGAIRGAEVLKIELNPKPKDKKRIEKFGTDLIHSFSKLKSTEKLNQI